MDPVGDAQEVNRVFDLHTRVFHSLPPLPRRWNERNGYSQIGLIVDTTQSPYGFKVVVVENYETSVYDSRAGAWTSESTSNLDMLYTCPRHPIIHSKNMLYIMCFDQDGGLGCLIQRYNLRTHVKEIIEFGIPEHAEWVCGSMGGWGDQCFAMGMTTNMVLTVWRMNNEFWNPWSEVDHMPMDLCKWVMGEPKNVTITFGGDKHVLLDNWYRFEKGFVLYNLEQKTWDKIEVVGSTHVVTRILHD